MVNIIHTSKLNKDVVDCLAKAANVIAYNSLIETAMPYKELPPKELALSGNRHLLLALSGGGDSTALLLALSEIVHSFDFRLSACHINHGLRGNESEADAEFCRRLCEQLKIDCEIIQLSLSRLNASKQGHFSEATLREKRYQCLTSFAQAKNISFLLTAHTLDDQIETLLFRLFRGTALTGLKGIEYCRKLDNNLYLLRPLLKLTKADCQLFLQKMGIEVRHDSSNSNEIYSRNYIRHKILPVISERFPDFSLHLDSLRETITAEDELFDKITHELFVQLESNGVNAWPLEIFSQQPLALQRRVLAHALKERSVAVSFKRLDDIIALTKLDSPSSACLNLNQKWRVRCRNNKLLWQEITPG